MLFTACSIIIGTNAFYEIDLTAYTVDGERWLEDLIKFGLTCLSMQSKRFLCENCKVDELNYHTKHTLIFRVC